MTENKREVYIGIAVGAGLMLFLFLFISFAASFIANIPGFAVPVSFVLALLIVPIYLMTAKKKRYLGIGIFIGYAVPVVLTILSAGACMLIFRGNY